jgi:hypothetical protein
VTESFAIDPTFLTTKCLLIAITELLKDEKIVSSIIVNCDFHPFGYNLIKQLFQIIPQFVNFLCR